MLPLFWGANLLVAGIACFSCAPHISKWEKRSEQSHPRMRVTGWSGTPKGIFMWRLIGVLLAIMGIFVILAH
jgi:hypothetical protein